MNSKLAAVLALGSALICGACTNHKFEKEFFFDHPPATRIERMRQYSLENQYRLFRYGNDRIEPPLMGLAEPIAEHGNAAVPFLLDKLNANADDITIRDILLIFETMQSLKAYDVKSDARLMETLCSRVSSMRDAEWKAICQRTLKRIE